MGQGRIFVAMGGNQGDVLATLREAVRQMNAWPDADVVAASRFWRTAPVDADGPDFVNAVVELQSTLAPEALLERLLTLEIALGRRRVPVAVAVGSARVAGVAARKPRHRYAARPIDLDLLLHGEHACNTPRLTLPHPHMHERAFVLAPLADIAPDLLLHSGQTVAALLRGLPDRDAVHAMAVAWPPSLREQTL